MRISDWSSDVCSSDLLELTRLTGSFATPLSGTLEGGAGRIGNVPLLMSDAAGSWRFANGKLSVQGGLQVADTAVPSRFNPLLSKDFALDFNGQRITALGTLIEPDRKSTRLNSSHKCASRMP